LNGYPVLEPVPAGSGTSSKNLGTGPTGTRAGFKNFGTGRTGTRAGSGKLDRVPGLAHPYFEEHIKVAPLSFDLIS